MGAAGGAMIFVSALAGCGLVDLMLLIYLSHSLLHVLTDTSAGVDTVRGSGEGLLDWWYKPLYCLGPLVLWLFIAAVVLAPFASAFEHYLCMVAAFVWLAYPLGLLGTLASGNPMLLIYPPLLGRLARDGLATLIVVLITLPLPILAGVFILAMLSQSFAWSVAAAVTLPAAILFYARAWGRLAWLALHDEDPPRPRKPGRRASSLALSATDPWALPEVEPESEVPELDVEVIPEPEDSWDDRTPYELVEEGKQTEGRPTTEFEATGISSKRIIRSEPSAVPLNVKPKRRQPSIEKPTLRRALGWPLFGFLFYPPTASTWVNLTILTLVALALFFLVAQTMPVG